MNKIQEIRTKYVEKSEKCKFKTDCLEGSISKLEAQVVSLKSLLKNTHWPSWIDMLIKPIAEMMLEKLPERRFEILGPFGMNNRTSIYFYSKGVSEKEKFLDNNCLGICFEPGDLDKGEIRVVDEKMDTGGFKEGTIGEMNGMNHPTQKMVDDVDWLLNWMRKQHDIKGMLI